LFEFGKKIISKLKAETKDLRKVNKSHQKLVGNLYKEMDRLKKRYGFSERR